jgi:hypothetical protein
MPINGGGPGRHRVGWKRPRLRWQQHQQVVMMMLVVWMLLCPDDTTKHHVSAVRIKTPRRRVTNVDGEDRPNVNTLKSWASSSFGQYPVLDEYLDEKGSFLDEYTELFNTKLAAAYDAMVDEIQPLRDAWDGLRSAYHLAWTGYYHGFVGLVYEYPWEGFSRDGILGLVTGTAAGVVHFSTMTTSGIAAGLYQAVRGLERTVTAIQATRDGMVWHNIRKEWFYYSLDKEAENVEHDNAEQIPGEGSTKRQLRRRVKDCTCIRYWLVCLLGASGGFEYLISWWPSLALSYSYRSVLRAFGRYSGCQRGRYQESVLSAGSCCAPRQEFRVGSRRTVSAFEPGVQDTCYQGKS